MPPFVIQAVVTRVPSLSQKSVSLGHRIWCSCRCGYLHYRSRFYRRLGCWVLRFPKNFPQRRRAAAAGQAGGQVGGVTCAEADRGWQGRQCCGSPAAPPPPDVAPPPPRRPTLLGNWSPGRRETLSRRPQPTGLTEIPGPMAQKPISTAAAERMNFVTQDRIW